MKTAVIQLWKIVEPGGGFMAQADIYRRALAEGMKELLRQETIEKITVEEVCEKSEISRRSFYRYFIDKYDVVSWIVDREYYDHLEVTKEKSLWELYPSFLQYLFENREWIRNALPYQGQNSLREHLFRRNFPIICNDFEMDFPSEYWKEFTVRTYFKMALESYEWWLGEKEPIAPEEMVKLTMSVVQPLTENINHSFQKYYKNNEH